LERLLTVLNFFAMKAIDNLEPEFCSQLQAELNPDSDPWNQLCSDNDRRNERLTQVEALEKIVGTYVALKEFADKCAEPIKRLYLIVMLINEGPDEARS
jgi:hypothetical protein